MAVLPIRITGDPVLHDRALEVTDFGPELHALVADMVDTMHEAPGVGLAAPQVGVGLRVFVWHWMDDADVVHAGTAVNPELWITPTPTGEADDVEESEGCLSIPGERFPLRRSPRAKLRAQDADGVPFELEADGWFARILQHEYDHLEGILYADRLDAEHAKAARKAVRKQNWGVAGLSWTPGIDHLED
jgi:peptide deformylase